MENIVGIYKQLRNIKELEENGLSIMDDDMTVLKNNILSILDEKGLNISELSVVTGISRQSINAVVHNKMKPGIDFVLKISYALDVKPEELFELTEDAWIRPYKEGRDVTLFVDMIHMAIVDNKQKKAFIEENGYEYYNIHTMEQLSKQEYESRLREFIDSNREALTAEMREEDNEMTANQIKSAVVEQLRNDFNQDYSKIYRKLGQKVIPVVL